MRDIEIEVFDDLLPEDWLNSLEILLTKGNNPTHWTFVPKTSSDEGFKNDLEKDNFQFIHILYHNQRPQSEHLNFFSMIFKYLPFRVGIITRIKANLSTHIPNFTKDNYQRIHTDWQPSAMEPNHKHSILLHVNESDGDTIFFDRKDTTKIVKRVPWKKGRIIVFRGDIPHAGQYPLNHPHRLVVNTVVENLLDKEQAEDTIDLSGPFLSEETLKKLNERG